MSRTVELEAESGSITWQAPSNIALVKYWGKREVQCPANPSLSFTLSKAVTTTSLKYEIRPSDGISPTFEVLLDGKPEEGFRPKIQTFFERARPYLPFLKDYHFIIETSNSFPHSSGIASSASGMAALALCLTDLERQASPGMEDAYFKKKASFLARLGSGSASRSIQGPLVQFGKYAGIPESSDLYAVPYPYKMHPVFEGMKDSILLVDKGEKQVSSTAGHNLMKGHPFAQARYSQAVSNLDTLKPVFAAGDLDGFVRVVESEALVLHAMMMSSLPYYVLMKPNTLGIIQRVWDYRRSEQVPLCFTLDAGANVHLLYPRDASATVERFIEEALVDYCFEGQYICDQIGFGAKKM